MKVYAILRHHPDSVSTIERVFTDKDDANGFWSDNTCWDLDIQECEVGHLKDEENLLKEKGWHRTEKAEWWHPDIYDENNTFTPSFETWRAYSIETYERHHPDPVCEYGL